MNDTIATRDIRDVLIVGGGIGGPVLGMWLRRLGLRVVVAEARAGAGVTEGAYLGLAPNGLHALAELGVAAAVAARGHACDSFEFMNRKGERISAIDRSADAQRFGWPLTMIRRSELHASLAEEAARRGVELRYGKRLVDLDRSQPARVVAHFEDGSAARADLVIGCDGLHSRTRRIVMPHAPLPAPLHLLDCGGFAGGVEPPLAVGCNVMVFGRRAFFGAFRTGTGETWWFHNGPLAQEPLDAAALRARLLSLHAEDPPWIRALIEATPELIGPWAQHELVDLPRWSAGRVALLGDAAHAMAPSAGQGAAMALEDALALAQCLRDCATLGQAFANFEQRRRPRVAAIANVARRNGSGKAVESRIAEWFRDLALPLFLRLAAAQQTASYAYRATWDAGPAGTPPSTD